jgi:uncharacterized membrane protein YhhN
MRTHLTWLAPLAALAAIGGALLGADGQWLYYIAKPLATILLFAFAWLAPQPVSRRYRLAVAVGLVWSLAGDCWLMFPGYFVAGLVSFLIAHLAYIVAFTDGTRLGARPLTWIACLGVGGVMLSLLWPGVPPALRIPVVAYMLALGTMAAQAITRWQVVAAGQGGDAVVNAARFAAIGGVLFMASDSLLAWGRFKGALPLSALLVLGTYYAAQWCIARSVTLGAPTSSSA